MHFVPLLVCLQVIKATHMTTILAMVDLVAVQIQAQIMLSVYIYAALSSDNFWIRSVKNQVIHNTPIAVAKYQMSNGQ